jgi:N-acetylglucosamine-6-phosphate deacetylase
VKARRLGVAAALVDGARVPGDVEVADGRVAAVGIGDGRRGQGLAVPGFVDLQVNGFAGVDFATADHAAHRHAAEALAAAGTTAFQPTLITAPESDLVSALRGIPVNGPGARVLGAHLEGPFLAPERMGAHLPEARREPDLALAERLLAAGRVSEMTLAPERPGALDLAAALRARGVVVSAGHTDATAEEAARAFDAGIRTVTHLFNAMRPFAHRDPGIAGTALAREDVTVQLILDGHHLAPETALMAWRAARGRVALVTDAIAAAGRGDGRYRLGGVEVTVRDGVARRDDGVLAGSTITMLAAVRHLCALGVPLGEALAAATAVPAAILGRDDVGVLAPGRAADIAVLDDRLELVAAYAGGAQA